MSERHANESLEICYRVGMCSHYQAEKRRKQLEKTGVQLPLYWEPPPGSMHIYPTQWAPIIRRLAEREAGDEAVPEMEMVSARFGLLPGFAKKVKYGLQTYNARAETVAKLASFRNAWAKARHCLVPCEAIYEPDWRSGKHIPTRITRADDDALGIAGLWAPWRNPEGKWIDSFAMITINADEHPMFKALHRPDPKRAPEQQDKRMVVILPRGFYAAWLDAPVERSMDFMKQFPADRLVAAPEPKLSPANGGRDGTHTGCETPR